MAERKTSQEDPVALAERAIQHPEQLTGSEIKRMAQIVLDHRKELEAGNKPSFAAKVIAKVGEILPDAVTGADAKPKKAAPKSKGSAKAADPAPFEAKESKKAEAEAGDDGKGAQPKPAPKPKVAPKAKAPAKPAPKAKAKAAPKG